MAYFAHLDKNNTVTMITVGADMHDGQELELSESSGLILKQTSYNTRGGIHYGTDGLPDGGIALRKNYAGIGYVYDEERDAFIPPKPYPSWLLNENTCLWGAPVVYPTDGKQYVWDEENTSWIEGI